MSTEAQRQPAVIEETADIPVERTYRVAKTAQRVLGHGPGETFTRALPPEQARLLLDGGALELLDQPTGPADSSTDGDVLPDGVEDHGGGWYTVDGEKVHGRAKLDALLAERSASDSPADDDTSDDDPSPAGPEPVSQPQG